jgi:hypothetical protein
MNYQKLAIVAWFYIAVIVLWMTFMYIQLGTPNQEVFELWLYCLGLCVGLASFFTWKAASTKL